MNEEVMWSAPTPLKARSAVMANPCGGGVKVIVYAIHGETEKAQRTNGW